MQKKLVPMFHVPDVRQTVDWYRAIGRTATAFDLLTRAMVANKIFGPEAAELVSLE